MTDHPQSLLARAIENTFVEGPGYYYYMAGGIAFFWGVFQAISLWHESTFMTGVALGLLGEIALICGALVLCGWLLGQRHWGAFLLQLGLSAYYIYEFVLPDSEEPIFENLIPDPSLFDRAVDMALATAAILTPIWFTVILIKGGFWKDTE